MPVCSDEAPALEIFPMKILRFLTLATISALAPLAQGQISSQAVVDSLSGPTITLNWADEQREFELAVDQIGTIDKTGAGQVIYYSPGATVEHAIFQVGARQRATGDRTSLVLYPVGEIRTAQSRVFVTSQILVRLNRGARASSVARTVNARVIEDEQSGTPGYAILEVDSAAASLATSKLLRNNPGVAAADPLIARQYDKFLVPNDTFFSSQWHLLNIGQGGGLVGIDARVTPVWDTRLGNGVGIGILDDGFQYAHPDLLPNANTVDDEDFNSSPNPLLRDHDPAPDPANFDFHGTSVGGVAGARGNNNLGVSGAAPNATLYGLRLIASAITDATMRDAFTHRNDIIHIKNNSWGVPDYYVKSSTTLPEDGLITGTTSGRSGRGTIYVFAAGNSGGSGASNANHRQPNNSRRVIAVGAIGNNGVKAGYSEPGANLVISAPSNGGSLGITTTDLIGNVGYNTDGAGAELNDLNYTNTFGGTSSAAPLVSGCIALVLQANSNLGWRDVKEILMRSASPVDVGDPDWITNRDGFRFNHKYGAGMINAQAAVALSTGWTNLGPETTASITSVGSTSVPDATDPGGPAGVTRYINFTPNFRVEHVVLTVNATTTYRGDLEFELISPYGTRSRMMDASLGDSSGQAIVQFPLSSVRFWGERSNGAWQVVVRDRYAADDATLQNVTLQLFGSNAGGGGGGPGPGPITPRYRGLRPSVWVANDLPLPIPDNNPVGVTSQLKVGPGLPITHVEITLRASHRASSELTFTLTSPDGTTATIANSSGARNFVTVSQGITSFSNENRSGNWQLRAVDNTTGLSGVVHGWSLKIW
jgi:subtilisin-like proprotein convertase family protein